MNFNLIRRVFYWDFLGQDLYRCIFTEVCRDAFYSVLICHCKLQPCTLADPYKIQNKTGCICGLPAVSGPQAPPKSFWSDLSTYPGAGPQMFLKMALQEGSCIGKAHQRPQFCNYPEVPAVETCLFILRSELFSGEFQTGLSLCQP